MMENKHDFLSRIIEARRLSIARSALARPIEELRERAHAARRDAARSLVVANAAAALHVGGATEDLRAAARLASESIDTGAALEKLERLIEATNQKA